MRYTRLVYVLLPSSLLSWADSLSDAQRTLLDEACRSRNPVLVYDSFPPDGFPIIDVNGDDQPDLFHGEFVEKLVQLSGHPTARLARPAQPRISVMVEQLTPLIEKIEAGEVQYSRFNFSNEIPLKISAFKKELFPEDDTIPEINSENIHLFKDRILQKLWVLRPDFRLNELYQLFQRIEKLRIPIVVAAGNFGPNFVNLYSLMPGVISVGSLDLDGMKRANAGNHALITVWRTGSVVTRMVQGGIDMNSDGVLDFPAENLTQGPVIAEMFAGKSVDNIVESIESDHTEWAKSATENPDVVPNAAFNILPGGLYRVEDIISLPTVTPETATLLSRSGKYVYKNPSKVQIPTYFFTDDGKGRITYDPLGDGSPEQRNMVAGTSYAAPVICKH